MHYTCYTERLFINTRCISMCSFFRNGDATHDEELSVQGLFIQTVHVCITSLPHAELHNKRLSQQFMSKPRP